MGLAAAKAHTVKTATKPTAGRAAQSKRPVMRFYESSEDQAARVVGVPVFREGDYPQGEFTADDVAELAATYNPDFLEAPLTPDHLQDGPAWGWWERFYAVDTPQGKELFGDVTLLFIGEFMWKSGMYKRRSIEFYHALPLQDGSEGMYVKAVSILGAATPAVKGLRNMFRDMPDDATVHGRPIFYDFASEAEAVEFKNVDYPAEDGGSAAADKTTRQVVNNFFAALPPEALAAIMGLPQSAVASLQNLTGQPGSDSEAQEGKTMKIKTGNGGAAGAAGAAAGGAGGTTTASEQPATPPAVPTLPAPGTAGFQQNPDGSVVLNAELFAQLSALPNLVNDMATRLGQTQAQLTQATAALTTEAAARQTAEVLAFNQTEDTRFSQVIKANRDKVSPFQEAIGRALFHAMPADADTDGHVTFTDPTTKKPTTLGARALVLAFMSAGAKVIDLDTAPESDNQEGIDRANRNGGGIPEPDSQEFHDARHERALELQAKQPEKFKDYVQAVKHAEAELLAQQPKPKKRHTAQQA